jgi:pimeloyl-ACP methyl ester carboxylesterase
VAPLGWVDQHLGRPRQVIAWGNSGGGLLSTLLAERHPERIDGAIPLCGPLGGVGTHFNLTLDFAFALRTLLTPSSDLELVRITNPDGTAARVGEIVHNARATPQGRARLALANALANVVPWARALQPRPTDVAGQVDELALYDTIVYIDPDGNRFALLPARAEHSPRKTMLPSSATVLVHATLPQQTFLPLP